MQSARIWFCMLVALWAAGAAAHGAGWRDPAEFEGQIRQFEDIDRHSPPPANPIVFIGSSTIFYWTSLTRDFSDLPVINRGIGSSHYSDLLHFYPRVIAPYRPGMVMLYSGDNDIAAGLGVGDVFTDLTNLVTRIRQDFPGTFVGIISVKPSPARGAFLGRQRDFNERARKFCEGQPQLRFIDVASAMLDQTGQPKPELFGPDRLHMSSAGYSLWQDLIRDQLEDWGPYRPRKRGTIPLVIGVVLAGAVATTIWLRQSRPHPVATP